MIEVKIKAQIFFDIIFIWKWKDIIWIPWQCLYYGHECFFKGGMKIYQKHVNKRVIHRVGFKCWQSWQTLEMWFWSVPLGTILINFIKARVCTSKNVFLAFFIIPPAFLYVWFRDSMNNFLSPTLEDIKLQISSDMSLT